MPFKRKGNCVYRSDTGEKKGCSKDVATAKRYLKALYANSSDIKTPRKVRELNKR